MADRPTSRKVEENIGATNHLLMDFTLNRMLLPSLDDLCLIHRTIFEGVPEEEHGISSAPGMLKKNRTFISLHGNQYLHHCLPERVALSYEEMLGEMRQMRAALGGLERRSGSAAEQIRKIQYVASFHARLMYIHPFDDGNGRTGRAVAVFQLVHLLGDEVPEFTVPPFWNRDLSTASDDPMRLPAETHSPEEYMRAMGKANENLMYLVRYFNFLLPHLEIREPIAPPVGMVKDVRSYPP